MKSLKLALATALVAAATTAQAAPVQFTQISTAFSNPIGIDYYEPTNQLILSSHYPSGSPSNLELVSANGAHTAYSALSGLTDELKIATVQSGYATGFAVGTVFTGNGQDGQIVKVDPGGAVVSNPWVSLPGSNNGIFRGSLYVDRTGLYNGDLLAVTTNGQLWRINAAGVPTQIGTTLGVHLEGLTVVPNNPAKWGNMAGCIIAGAEDQALMHSWCRDASGAMVHSARSLNGIRIEDLDIIDGGNFFGVNYGTGKLVGAAASEFAAFVGDILVTQEFPSQDTGLFVMSYDLVNQQFTTTSLTAAFGSTGLGQWEHVTFARAGVQEIPPVGLPVSGTAWLAALGLAALGAARRRRRP